MNAESFDAVLAEFRYILGEKHMARLQSAHEAGVAELRAEASYYRMLRDGGTKVCVRAEGENPIHRHLPAYYPVRGDRLDAYMHAQAFAAKDSAHED